MGRKKLENKKEYKRFYHCFNTFSDVPESEPFLIATLHKEAKEKSKIESEVQHFIWLDDFDKVYTGVRIYLAEESGNDALLELYYIIS